MSAAPRRRRRAPGRPAARAGLAAGDEIVAINGQVPRDVIEYQLLADEADARARRAPGRPRAAGRGGQGGRASRSASRCTPPCSTRCAPATTTASSASSTSCRQGLRRSLYLKDDDYRLSFLYGNFTTLTRFTEADLERVVTERLSPLYVSIHATDPDVRADMLRNRRGATSLRWLRALLDHGIEVHGQIVVCPGVNDGAVLDDTLAGVLDRVPRAGQRCACVPLGVSRFNTEAAHAAPHRRPRPRPWSTRCERLAGRLPRGARPPPGVRRRRVLPAGRPAVPAGRRLRGLRHARGRHRHGPHLRAASSTGAVDRAHRRPQPGFFAWVDGAPAEGYRAPRAGRSAPGHAGAAAAARRRAGRRPHRRATAPRSSRPLVGGARPRRRPGRRRSTTSSSAATSASPA